MENADPILNSIVEWMGVEDEEELNYCLPNRHQIACSSFKPMFLSKTKRFVDLRFELFRLQVYSTGMEYGTGM